MDSMKNECEYISSHLIREYSKWYDINQCLCRSERSELILSFFRFTKNLNLQTRTKERVVLFYDRCSWDACFSQDYNKIFLVSILNIIIKIESGTDEALKVLKILIDTSSKVDSSYISYPRLKMYDVHNAELFVLNSIDWKISLFSFFEFLDFFKKFLLRTPFLIETEVKKNINIFVNYYTESSLVCFKTNEIPLHQISLIIIALALYEVDQKNYEKAIIELLVFCKNNFLINLSSLLDHFKIFYDFLWKIKIKNFHENLVEKMRNILQKVNILTFYENANNLTSTYPFHKIKTKRKLNYNLKEKNKNFSKMFLCGKKFLEVQSKEYYCLDSKKKLTKKYLEDCVSETCSNSITRTDSKGI